MMRETAELGEGRRGAWDEQAWHVRMLAAELGLVVDGETLLYCDVRDLLVWRRRLALALQGGAARQRPRLPWPGSSRRSRIPAGGPGGTGLVLERAPRGR
jgi:hypothetical protein